MALWHLICVKCDNEDRVSRGQRPITWKGYTCKCWGSCNVIAPIKMADLDEDMVMADHRNNPPKKVVVRKPRKKKPESIRSYAPNGDRLCACGMQFSTPQGYAGHRSGCKI